MSFHYNAANSDVLSELIFKHQLYLLNKITYRTKYPKRLKTMLTVGVCTYLVMILRCLRGRAKIC